jgi:hypothetical protein
MHLFPFIFRIDSQEGRERPWISTLDTSFTAMVSKSPNISYYECILITGWLGAQRQSSGWFDAAHCGIRIHILYYMGLNFGEYDSHYFTYSIAHLSTTAPTSSRLWTTWQVSSSWMGGQTSSVHPACRTHWNRWIPWNDDDEGGTEEESETSWQVCIDYLHIVRNGFNQLFHHSHLHLVLTYVLLNLLSIRCRCLWHQW